MSTLVLLQGKAAPCGAARYFDALLGIGLAHAGASSHDLRHIGFVRGAKVLVALKTRRPQSQDFPTRLIGICAARRGRD
jgi:hypothetical protein